MQGKRSWSSDLIGGHQSNGKLSKRKNWLSADSQASGTQSVPTYPSYRFCGRYHHGKCDKSKNRCFRYGLIRHIQ